MKRPQPVIGSKVMVGGMESSCRETCTSFRIVPAGRITREATAAFVRRSSESYFHPVGTCAMGPGREAVVDAELCVRGIEGLRIADASIMPEIPAGNTNAPSIMIGEFASRLLVKG